MTTATVDLWPENIGVDSEVTTAPVTILKQQAILLGEKTHNLVIAEVNSEALGPHFAHGFYVVAPTLNYKYRLFVAKHTIELYPVQIDIDDGQVFHATDPDDFMRILRWEILSSNRTRSILHALIAQVES